MKKIKFFPKQINQFKKMGIETIYLFGSQAQGHTHPLSDVDIGIVFSNPEKHRDNTLDVYNKLYRIFTDVLPSSYLRRRFKLRAHEFDLVFLQFAPISLQFAVIENNKILYERNKEKRFQYEEYVLKRYCDLKHFYDISYKCLLERI